MSENSYPGSDDAEGYYDANSPIDYDAEDTTTPANENTAKHTPGPWRINQYGTIVARGGHTLNVDGVALLMGPTAESKANSRLLAAAPELLTELEYIVGNLEELVAAGAITDDGEFITRGRAAIAKATGE